MDDKNMEQVLEKAQVLIEALPYIQRFNRKIIVVKYGGSAMVDEGMNLGTLEVDGVRIYYITYSGVDFKRNRFA